MEVQCPFQINWEPLPAVPNFGEYFFNRIHTKFGKSLALIEGETGKQWRYSDLLPWAVQCQQNMKEAGIKPGTRVGFLTLNVPEVIIAHLANSLMGNVIVCLNPMLTIDELWHQIDLSDIGSIITIPNLVPRVEEVRKKAGVRGGTRLKRIVLLENLVLPPPRKKPQPSMLETLGIPGSGGRRRQSVVGHNMVGPTSSNGIQSSQSAEAKPEQENAENEEAMEDKPIERSASTINLAQSGYGGLSVSCTTSACGTFIIFFTSGTTGLPKPIEISHKSLIINLQQMSVLHMGPPCGKDRFLLQLGMHHMNGALVAYFALYNGCTGITIPKYTHEYFLNSIQDFKITHVHVTPLTVHMMARDEIMEQFDMSSIKTMTCAGAPLDPNMAAQCVEKHGLKDLRQSYGLTEACGAVTWSFMGCSHYSAVGAPLPGMLFKIAGEGGSLKGPREPGELLIKGPQVIPRCYKNPKSTNELFDKDGYLKTGDLAYYDENGYFYIVDRIKDLLRSKGQWMSPSEVENLLRELPGVDDCAILGRSEAGRECPDSPAAFITRAPNYPTLSSGDVRNHTLGKIAVFKELRGGVFFVSDIPRGSSGKINRRLLGAQFARERTTLVQGVPVSTKDLVLARERERVEREKDAAASRSGSPIPGKNKVNLTKAKRTGSAANINKPPAGPAMTKSPSGGKINKKVAA